MEMRRFFFIFIQLILVTRIFGCHVRMGYISACVRSGTRIVDYTLQESITNQDCGCSVYDGLDAALRLDDVTSNFDFLDFGDSFCSGAGPNNLGPTLFTAKNTVSTNLNYGGTTSTYTVGGVTVLNYKTQGSFDFTPYYPSGPKIITTRFDINARHSINNVGSTLTPVIPILRLDLNDPNNLCAPQFASPNIIYMPLKQKNNFYLGVSDADNNPVTCSDVTTQDSSGLQPIKCGSPSTSPNILSSCSITWDTTLCTTEDQNFIRIKAADATSSTTLDTVIVLLDAPPLVCTVNGVMSGSSPTSPYVYWCTFGTPCTATPYSVPMVLTRATGVPNGAQPGDTVSELFSTDLISPVSDNLVPFGSFTTSGSYPAPGPTVYSANSFFQESRFRFQTVCSYSYQVRQYGQLSVFAYFDDNIDAQFDGADVAAPGMKIQSYQVTCGSTAAPTGAPESTCNTDAGGGCLITLIPGVCYAFQLTVTGSGYFLNPTYSSQNTFAPSSLIFTGTITDNQSIVATAAVIRTGSVQIVSWVDQGCIPNGIQDPSELSASGAGIYVKLVDSTGIVVAQGNADITFSAIIVGTYTVEVSILPPYYYTFTTLHVGSPSQWNDIDPTTASASVVVNPAQTSIIRIGVVKPEMQFIHPTSFDIWQMYLPQKIELCKSPAVQNLQMQIEVRNNANVIVFTIVYYWDGVSEAGSYPFLMTSNTVTYWIPHHQIPGTYHICAVFTDTQTRRFCSQNFLWKVRV